MSLIYRSIIVILLAAGALFAEDKPVEPKTYLQPALLTSCGQAADVQILKGLCARAGVDVKYRALASGDSLSDVKAVMIVAGGSSKGLGAAKADAGAEETRIKGLVKAAQKAKLPIIVFHVGGEARRGALSDPFNKLAAEAGEVLIVGKEGDQDGFFKKIAEKSKARYILIENAAAVPVILKELFPKKVEPVKAESEGK